MANQTAENVFNSKLAARKDMAEMLWPTLGATLLYFLPLALLSVAFSAVSGAFDESIAKSLTNVRLLQYLGIYLLAELLITQPIYFGLTQFYALRRAGARPSMSMVTICFSSLRLYGKAILMTLTIAVFTVLWSIPAAAVCAAGYGIYLLLPNTLGWFLFYELAILAVIFVAGMISRYHCAYALLIEQPELSCWKAVRLAAQQFSGHKREVFSLLLSFFLWFLLSVLTSGILMIIVCPYYLLSLFHLFDRVRGVQIKVEQQQKPEQK